MTTHMLIVAIAQFLGMIIGKRDRRHGLSIAAMASAALWMFLLGPVYAAIALILGALTGDRRLTMPSPAA